LSLQRAAEPSIWFVNHIRPVALGLEDNLSQSLPRPSTPKMLIIRSLDTIFFGIRPAPKTTEEDSSYRGVQVQMKNQIGWLAFLMVLAYEAIQLIPPGVFNHAVSFIASAVWGS
jgi:hypothetical protein